MIQSQMQHRLPGLFPLAAVLITTVALLLTDVLPQNCACAQGMPEEPPSAGDDFAYIESTAQGVSINILDNDYGIGAPIDPTSVKILTSTESGTATVNTVTGEIEFFPEAGSEKLDCLLYEVSDQDGQVSNPAFLVISVFHTPPTAFDDYEMLSYTGDAKIDVLSNDDAGSAPIDPGSVTIVTPPTNGTAVVDGVTGEVTYTPDALFSGSDSFVYTIADMSGVESEEAVVGLTVENTPPTVVSFSATPESLGTWAFEGVVEDERPETTTVEFGGVISGTATPDETGYFRELINVPPGTYGFATATATDELGEQSEPAEAPVYSY